MAGKPTSTEEELSKQFVRYAIPAAELDRNGPVAEDLFREHALELLRRARADLLERWKKYRVSIGAG